MAKKKIDIETPDEEIDTQAEEKEQETPQAEEVEQTIEEKLVAELAAQKEAYLRLAAEYDNFRKRTAKKRKNLSLVRKQQYLRTSSQCSTILIEHSLLKHQQLMTSRRALR